MATGGTMSRSRSQQCSVGRGCPVCGDAGESRRDRDDDVARIDERQLLEEAGFDIMAWTEDMNAPIILDAESFDAFVKDTDTEPTQAMIDLFKGEK